MICFEVYRNGKKVCTAGVGTYGVMSAIISFVSHNPRKLAKWAAEGRDETDPTELILNVGGIQGDHADTPEFVRWTHENVAAGDELTVRIVDLPKADRPRSRRRENPKKVKAAKKRYVKAYATDVGLEVRPKRAAKKPRAKPTKKKRPGKS